MSLTHRFLNADAFASTGQGLLGNNMFAYCGNNPVNYADPKGNLPSFRPVYFDHGENQRIYNQRAEPYASKTLGDYTVSYNGCGAIATFNALVALGNPKSLDEVLAYYNGNPLRTFMNGKHGMLPHQVASFLTVKDIVPISRTHEQAWKIILRLLMRVLCSMSSHKL